MSMVFSFKHFSYERPQNSIFLCKPNILENLDSQIIGQNAHLQLDGWIP